jgi:hypothetical protein
LARRLKESACEIKLIDDRLSAAGCLSEQSVLDY